MPGLSRQAVIPSLTASLIEQEHDSPMFGQWYSDDTYFFNLSLTGRPASACGRFADMPGDFQTVGDLFFLPVSHRYLAKGGPGRETYLFVEIRAGLGDSEMNEDLSPVLRTCINLPFDRLRGLVLEIAREVQEPGFASEMLIEGLGITLLAETLRSLQKVRDGSARKGGLSPWRLRAIEARVREGDTLPTIIELAQLCGLSRRHLMRAFREETGQTVSGFVQSLTFDRAKALLSETKISVGEIAGKVGFTNAAAFSTAFRRKIGESPRSYRQMQNS